MSEPERREVRLAFVRKPDLNVLGKANEIGADCASICKFYA